MGLSIKAWAWFNLCLRLNLDVGLIKEKKNIYIYIYIIYFYKITFLVPKYFLILVKFYIISNLIYLFIYQIIIKLIMTSSQFDLDSTLKTLNLSLFWFIERSGFENHGLQEDKDH